MCLDLVLIILWLVDDCVANDNSYVVFKNISLTLQLQK